MAKKFVRTTKEVWDNKNDKSQYNNSIVFIEDTKLIWSNGTYYAANIDWSNVLNNPILTDGDGDKFLSNDGIYKSIIIPEMPSLDGYAKIEDIPVIPTKLSEFKNDCNFVSLEKVQLMILEALASLDITTDPDIPESDTPLEGVGAITENNSIVIDETQLENGTYSLMYIDSNDNIIDNFNEITSFEINK